MELLSNKKFLWTIIAMLLILNVASLATIWLKDWDDASPGLRPQRMLPARDHFLKHELNFSSDQQVLFDALLDKHREEIQLKIEEIRTLREDLMNLMRNQNFKDESLEIVHKIGDKQSELELLNYNHFKGVMAICNDDQKQILIETLKRAVGPHHRNWHPDDRDLNFREPGRRGRR